MATKETGTQSPRQFAIPADLMKMYKEDIRTLPHILPINGWIVFDRAMLVSILRSDDVEKRMNLANQLEKLDKAGGELVIMQQ